jgi:hypothetical protein
MVDASVGDDKYSSLAIPLGSDFATMEESVIYSRGTFFFFRWQVKKMFFILSIAQKGTIPIMVNDNVLLLPGVTITKTWTILFAFIFIIFVYLHIFLTEKCAVLFKYMYTSRTGFEQLIYHQYLDSL